MADFWKYRKSDYFFRFLFGFNGHEHILKGFINMFLQDAGFPLVQEATLHNPYNLKTVFHEKESILDIQARDNNQRIFNIELLKHYMRKR